MKTESLLTDLGIPAEVAKDLVRYFVQLSDELHRGALEKSSGGKFVETIVQALQALESKDGHYDRSVKNVDAKLRKFESASIGSIPDDSRVAILRAARSMYCLRNKRSIVHKNNIDPNLYDLELLQGDAKWIMTELIRLATAKPMEEARLIIEKIQRPVFPIVEEIMGRLLVLDPDLPTREEALVILYSEYSKEGTTSLQDMYSSMDRVSKSAVRGALRTLRDDRLVEGDGRRGYRLTKTGVKEAINVLRRITAPQVDR